MITLECDALGQNLTSAIPGWDFQLRSPCKKSRCAKLNVVKSFLQEPSYYFYACASLFLPVIFIKDPHLEVVHILCPLIGHKFLILLSKKTTKRGEGGQNFADFETTQFMDGPLRGYYLTTLATFWLFDHLPPLPYVEIFYLIFTNKSTFFNYLPTSSCQRSKKMDLQIKI